MSNGMRYTTRSQGQIEKAERVSTTLNEKYRVEWGEDHTYTVICDDEDRYCRYERHADLIIGLTPLRYSERAFVTIGLDHHIQICEQSGRLLSSLLGHTDRILGLIELNDHWLLSASQDGTLRIWNIKNGNEIAHIKTKVSDIKNVNLFSDSHYFSVCESDFVTIWDISGRKIALITALSSHIQSILQLGNNNWLVKAENRNPGIWDQTGQFICEFAFNFDLSHDIVELTNDQYIIREPDHSLSLWDAQGNWFARHEPNSVLFELFVSLKNETNRVSRYIQAHPEIIDFPHYRNPLHGENSVFIPRQARHESETSAIDSNAPERKFYWDFFHRPLFGPVKTALKDTVRLSRTAISQLEQQEAETITEWYFHQQKRLRYARWSAFWLMLSVLSGGITFVASTDLLWTTQHLNNAITALIGTHTNTTAVLIPLIGGCCAILMLAFSLKDFRNHRRHKEQQHQKQFNLEVTRYLPPAFEQLISNIKHYRYYLLKTIPIVENSALFTGAQEKQAMDHVIHGKLEAMAFAECGLQQADIIHPDQKPIVLKDWALIQDHDKRERMSSKLNLCNAQSFWSASDDILFAVQYVQYLFLTQDKIDVFTTYYDFITDQCMGKATNAFYYKDVTNIAKREVERTGCSACPTTPLSATEITLSIASGEKISITLLNEDSVAVLAHSAQNNETPSRGERLDRLQHDRRTIAENVERSEAIRQDEIDLINAEISDLQHQSLEQDVTRISNAANEAIQHIRTQLKQHKQYHENTEAPPL
ncbi:MAG: WD40 repeat domain-containing protein [Gammaproteobacteria bacterium]